MWNFEQYLEIILLEFEFVELLTYINLCLIKYIQKGVYESTLS